MCSQGDLSQSSGEKTAPPMGAPKLKHVTMKCGWICLECRAVEFGFDRLGYHLCKGRSVHKKVLCAAYMCQNCPQISDDLAQFNQSGCPCSFDSKGPEPAVARAAVATESGESKPLAIRPRSGRIGGTYMEVQCYGAAKDKASPEPCDKPIPTKTEKPSTHVTLEAKKPSLPIASRAKPSPLPLNDEEIAPVSKQTRAALESVIRDAEQELQKVLVLQALANERRQLEDLLFQKSQRGRSTAIADAGT